MKHEPLNLTLDQTTGGGTDQAHRVLGLENEPESQLVGDRHNGAKAGPMSELGLKPVRDRALVNRLCSHCNGLVKKATAHNGPVSRFPGTMPLSLSRRHLNMIASSDYVALEKSDGMRYMLMAVKDFVVLFDRRMTVFIVEPNPSIPSFDDPACPQDNTLLDGELTYNLTLEKWEYLVYDAVAIDGDLSVAKLHFRQRLRAAETYVAAPRVFAPIVSGRLRLRVKDYYEKSDLRRMFENIKKKPNGDYVYMNHHRRDGPLCNLNDGVIFAPCKMPYVVKNCSALLKWKPPQLNSVDFELQLERAQDPRTKSPTVRSYIAFRSTNGANHRLREVYFPSKLKRSWATEFDKYNGAIVELSFDPAAGEWRYIRMRSDKDIPNFSATVIDTMESIAESMDREELTLYLEKRSAPIPNDVEAIVRGVQSERKKCVFSDDLFDEANSSYVTTLPMSNYLPPLAQTGPPRRKDPGTWRRENTPAKHHSGPEKAGDDSHARRGVVAKAAGDDLHVYDEV